MTIAAWAATAVGLQGDSNAPLSKMGPAPDFTLTNQDGKSLSLSALRGKVVAVFFWSTANEASAKAFTKMVYNSFKRS